MVHEAFYFVFLLGGGAFIEERSSAWADESKGGEGGIGVVV